MMFIRAFEGGFRIGPFLVAEPRETTWHIGEPFPDLGNPRVVKIQADEDELAYLLDRMKTEVSR